MSRREYLRHKEAARTLVKNRLAYFNTFYGFKINRIAIKNSRSRWGSASKKGNLNFNYRVVLLSPDMADYVIVHELCHLGEFNHSAKFWELVEKAVPDHVEIRKRFKTVRM